MGKKKVKKKAVSSTSSEKIPEKTTTKLKWSLEDLLKKTEELVDNFDFDLAKTFCERAMEMSPENTKVLELLASIDIERGDLDSAEALLRKCVSISPDEGYHKYLSLAQLMSGKDSETHTKRAIHLMRKEIHRKEKCMHSSLRSIKRDLSNGLASLCELYMTDLCDEDEAEENCIRCADEAIDVDPNNPDAYLPKTSYLLMKGQVTGQDGARSLLEKSVSLWLPGATALRLNQTPPPGFSEEMIPCYPQRTAAAKLAIELEMWDAASEILEGLLEEKDDVIETWYLSGVACHLQKDVSSARMYFENALTVAEKTPKDELSHEMMEDIREKLRTLPPKEESEDNVTDDDDDGSDDNSEDEVMDADDGDR